MNFTLEDQLANLEHAEVNPDFPITTVLDAIPQFTDYRRYVKVDTYRKVLKFTTDVMRIGGSYTLFMRQTPPSEDGSYTCEYVSFRRPTDTKIDVTYIVVPVTVVNLLMTRGTLSTNFGTSIVTKIPLRQVLETHLEMIYRYLVHLCLFSHEQILASL